MGEAWTVGRRDLGNRADQAKPAARSPQLRSLETGPSPRVV